MRRPSQPQRRRAWTSPRLHVESLEARRLLATITVTGTGDTIAADGIVTLREAITAANTDDVSGDAAAGSPGLDTIAFNIAGVDVRTIVLAADLPAITDELAIDGYTQPGASPNTNGPGLGNNATLRVQIVPSEPRFGSNGLRVTAGQSTVRGLILDGFATGINLQASIGGSTIAGNYIGTTPDGSDRGARSPAAIDAVLLQSSNNTIGGVAPADRNLLNSPIHVPLNPTFPASDNVIQGNFLGIDATGKNSLLGSSSRILIESGSGDRIGGAGAGEGNLISGGNGTGIFIKLGGPAPGSALNGNGGHIIRGNLIGTDLTGAAVPSFRAGGSGLSNGITILPRLPGEPQSPTIDPLPIAIGGAQAGEGNVFGGITDQAIRLEYRADFTAPTAVRGNFIGTDRAGTVVLGGGDSGGISLNLATTRNVTIAGNTIAFNGSNSAVIVPGGETGNLIVANSIHDNGRGAPGIIRSTDLGPAIPSLASAAVSGINTLVQGTTRGAVGTTMRVDLFANATPTQGLTVQGQTPVKSLQVLIGADGTGAFTASFPTVASQPLITATATSPSDTTSPFSAPAPLLPPVVTAADLDVKATATPNPVAAGDVLTYTIVVTNTGPDAAESVTLTGVIPASTTFISFSAPAGWTVAAPAVGGAGATSATASTLAVGGVATFTLSLRVAAGTPAGARISYTAMVASSASDPSPSNNSATREAMVVAVPPVAVPPVAVPPVAVPPVAVLPVSDLVVAVAAPATVLIGADLTYTVTVNNRGPALSAPGVRLTFTVPAGTTFVSATTSDGMAVQADGTVTAVIGPIGDRPATVTIVVRPTVVGSLIGTAHVVGDITDPNAANDASAAVTLVNAPVLASALELKLHQDQERRAYLAYARALRGQIRPTDLPARARAERALRRVLAALRAHWALEAKTRTISAFNFPAPPATDLSVSMVASPQPIRLAGGPLTYTVTVSNRGSVRAMGVTLVDTLPAGVDFISATGGAVPDEGVLTFRLGNLARGAARTLTIAVLPGSVGTLINTAVVSANQPETNGVDNTATGSALVAPAPATSTPAQIRIKHRAERGAYLAFRQKAVDQLTRGAAAQVLRELLLALRAHWAAEMGSGTSGDPFKFPDI
ncbi:hypothetical protein EP7_003423 [Isosphaeraceae bacterium EP7]